MYKLLALGALALAVPFAFRATAVPASAAPTSAAAPWKVDEGHSSVVFRVKHFYAPFWGRFDKVSGSVQWDAAKPEAAAVELSIDAGSVNTNDAKRDDHLRGPDFFDVKQFPKASFKSTKVVPDGESKMKVDGDLTLHGVTKPISFVVEKTGSVDDPKFGKKTGFHATLVVKRSEFGITYMKGGLGEDVEFMVSLEANEG